MKLIFVSSSCSTDTYKKIFIMRTKKIIDPMQKFMQQIMVGTSKNTETISISALPISATTVKKRVFKKKIEKSGMLTYVYPRLINGKIMRYLTGFLYTFFETSRIIKYCKDRDSVVLICDPLCLQSSIAARLAGKLKNVKSIGLVTDVPLYATEMKQHNYSKLRHSMQLLYESITMNETMKYDGYILLTESMNEMINLKNKPYIVLEGTVDLETINNTDEHNIKQKRIIMYAGGIYVKYGVKQLVDAFIAAKISDVELHLYGEGSYVDELNQICKKHNNIKYKGCVITTELPKLESKASLLVNPRFSNEEYTKYSFPSKTLEYMSTGTPVLTTRLKGIPSDYEEYLYWFDGESTGEMAEKLSYIMNLPQKEFEEFGNRALAFVKNKKNNITQGQRIIKFAREL